MSVTFAQLRSNIRNMIHDTNQADYAIKGDEMDREIIAALQRIAVATFSGALRAPFCTLSAGAREANATAGEYVFVVDLFLATANAYGERLERLDQKAVDEMAVGTYGGPPTGRPHYYYLLPKTTGSVTAYFDKYADQEYSIHAVYVTAHSGTTGAPTVSEFEARAVEHHVAATCILKMDGEARNRLKINADVAPQYMQTAAAFMEREARRLTLQQAVAHIAPVVQ